MLQVVGWFEAQIRGTEAQSPVKFEAPKLKS